MSIELLESFLSARSSTYLDAERALAEMGSSAIPILEAFFSGKACNRWGVPYRSSGNAMRCAFATVSLLGPTAKPLERWLRAELKDGNHMCAGALAALQVLDAETVEALASCVLQPSSDIAWQAAAALIRCGYKGHPAFQSAIASLAEDKRPGARMLERYISQYAGD